MIKSTNKDVFTDYLVCKLIADEALYVLKNAASRCHLSPGNKKVLLKLNEFLKDAAKGRRLVKKMVVPCDDKPIKLYGLALKVVERLVYEGKVEAPPDTASFLLELQQTNSLLLGAKKVETRKVKRISDFCAVLRRV